jgi:hypothetical protein
MKKLTYKTLLNNSQFVDAFTYFYEKNKKKEQKAAV